MMSVIYGRRTVFYKVPVTFKSQHTCKPNIKKKIYIYHVLG